MADKGIQGQIFFSCTIGDIEISSGDELVENFMMIESLSKFMPEAQISIKDDKHRLTERLGLSPVDEIVVRLGKNLDDADEYKFNLFSIKEGQTLDLLSNTSSHLNISLIMDGWKDVFQEQKIRSWEKTSSLIIQEIADECDCTYDTDTTLDKRAYIQAMWTNAQMIRHLAKYAKNSSGDGGFVYNISREKQLLFYSFKGLYNRSSVANLELKTDPSSLINEDGTYKENNIINMAFSSNARMFMSKGAYGKKNRGYDIANKSFKRTNMTIDNTSYQKLAPRLFLSQNDVESIRYMYEFEKEFSDLFASGEIIEGTANLFYLDVLVVYNKRIKIGNKVNVLIPGAIDEDRPEAIKMLETLSGEYIVSMIVHYYGKHQKMHLCKLRLIRDGIGKKIKTSLKE